jgi:hypothetical protein
MNTIMQVSPFTTPLPPQKECFRASYTPDTGICAGKKILVSSCMSSLQQLEDQILSTAAKMTPGAFFLSIIK